MKNKIKLKTNFESVPEFDAEIKSYGSEIYAPPGIDKQSDDGRYLLLRVSKKTLMAILRVTTLRAEK